MLSQLDVDTIEYTCPTCSATTNGPVSISSEVETMAVQPLTPAWEGGPLITDYGRMPEHKTMNQWFWTNVCEDRFSRRQWDVSVTTRADRTGTLTIKRKGS